jgi:SAM-dependent methyltransferase
MFANRLASLRAFHRSVLDLTATARRVENLLLETTLSPIDRHLVHDALTRSDGLFHDSYDRWRATRINKMLEIYGVDFFTGKRILELGAGHGDIGAFFAELGASVLCLEGRPGNVAYGRLKYRKLPGLKIEQADLAQDFSNFGRFDLIIHFGLLYHIEDVEGHMKTVLGMADDVILETVVADSTDPQTILIVPERSEVNEEAIHGVGSRPSPFYIERIAEEQGFGVERYFHGDLNTDGFVYDWAHKNDNSDGGWWKRRLWRFRRNA